MSEVDEIDERRALIIAQKASFECMYDDDKTNRACIGLGDPCKCRDTARAIRLSVEAAGYISAKLEGVVNEKDRKG